MANSNRHRKQYDRAHFEQFVGDPVNLPPNPFAVMGQETPNTGGFREGTAPPCDFGYVEAQMDMLENNSTHDERRSQLITEAQNINSKHQIQNQVFYH